MDQDLSTWIYGAAQDVDLSTAEVSPADGKYQVVNGRIVFADEDNYTTYTVTVKTPYTEGFEAHKFYNTASLIIKPRDQEVVVAEHTADAETRPDTGDIIGKTHSEEGGVITWVITVNPKGLNIAGMTLSDQWNQNYGPYTAHEFTMSEFSPSTGI